MAKLARRHGLCGLVFFVPLCLRGEKFKLIPLTPYRAPWWLPGGHAQTLYAYFFIRAPRVFYRRERWELADGDFLDLDWLDGPPQAPLLVLFHGLEGDSQGFYARALMAAVRAQGWRGVVAHFRGCSGEPNRLPRAYFAGDSGDIGTVLMRLKAAHAGAPLHAVGVSLGGNALLKWLGEQGAAAAEVLERAVAVSAPVDLTAAGGALDRGFNRRVYTAHFLHSLRRKALDKLRRYPGLYDGRAVTGVRSLRAFDDLVTAPLHGYRDADDYWRRASSKPGLVRVRVPTLLINARNDPFLPAHVLPRGAEVSSRVVLDYPAQGGHAAFPGGPFPGHIGWLAARVLGFLQESL